MKTPIFFAGLAFAALMSPTTARSETVTLYTTEAPPLTMTGSELSANSRGFIVDIVAEAARRSGIDLQVETLPWRRAQTIVAAGENLLITPLSRVPSRETAYSWIAPIFRFERAFATLDRKIDSFDQAKHQLKSILVGKGTSEELALVDHGFPDAQLHRHEVNVGETDMLLTGRADAWFEGIVMMQWRWRAEGISRPLTIGATVSADDIYLACSRSCSSELISRLRAALEKMRADGSFSAIQAHYLDRP